MISLVMFYKKLEHFGDYHRTFKTDRLNQNYLVIKQLIVMLVSAAEGMVCFNTPLAVWFSGWILNLSVWWSIA